MIYNYIIHKYQSGLQPYQTGLQPDDSTANQFVDIFNTIISSLDKGKYIRFIFCDFSKAFDKVWHNNRIYVVMLLVGLRTICSIDKKV